MAERKLLALDAAECFPEEIDTAVDTVTFAGLTLGGDLVMGGNSITGLGVGVAATDAVNKSQLDAAVGGLRWKEPMVVRAQGNVNLAAPGATLDGISMTVGDRFAAPSQTVTTEDGFYIWNGAAVAATRSPDCPTGGNAASAAYFIEQGTDADVAYVITNDSGSAVVGTDDLVDVAFTGAAGLADATAASGGGVKGKITVDSDLGLEVVSGVLAIDLEPTAPGLQFTGGDLQVLADPNGCLEVNAAGVAVKLDGTTLQCTVSGLSVLGLPALFEVAGVATGAAVTAANLDTLTDGSNADALHTHAGANVSINADAGGVTIGDPIYISGADVVGDADAATVATARGVIGLAGNTAASGAGVAVINDGNRLDAVLTGATFNDPVYLAAGGGVTLTKPAAGNAIVIMGRAINATDMIVNTQYLGKRAA